MTDITTYRLQAPTGSRSGYGERSREILRALNRIGGRVQLDPYRWAGLQVDDPPQATVLGPDRPSPDVHVFVGLARQMQTAPGAFNVLVTAGTEVDRVRPDDIQGANTADLVIVPSIHSKRVLESTGYRVNGQLLRVETRVVVLPEFPEWEESPPETEISRSIGDRLGDRRAFLCVGQWLDTRPAVGRKGISQTLDLFNEAHRVLDDPPALVLKTDLGSLSRDERRRCRETAAELSGDCEVVLVQGELTSDEMQSLYAADWAQGLVSLTKGEGFGRPVLEAGLHGLPVVCPGYTGLLDHTDADLQVLIGGRAVDVPTELIGYTDSYPSGSQWMQPDTQFALQAVAAVHNKNEKYQRLAKEHMKALRERFRGDALVEKLRSELENGIQPRQQPQGEG
jgi:glycosyltransferase involved in cell wall biosynthesis